MNKRKIIYIITSDVFLLSFDINDDDSLQIVVVSSMWKMCSVSEKKFLFGDPLDIRQNLHIQS